MSEYASIRELLGMDSREGFSSDAAVCVDCMNGTHDHVYRIDDFMKCGCECHTNMDTRAAAGSKA